jgi:light-regulated signal transduction histidine kinase (bacteriophytochrome)
MNQIQYFVQKQDFEMSTDEIRKIRKHSEELNELISKQKDVLVQLQQEMQRSQLKGDALNDETSNRFDSMESGLQNLKKLVEMMRKQDRAHHPAGNHGTIYPTALTDLEEDILKVKGDLDALKLEYGKQLRNIEIAMNDNSVSKSDLNEFENR